MPKLATPLTDLRIKAAKPKDNPYQLADGGGMYLEIMPKIWRMAYRQANRTTSTRLTFGPYPAQAKRVEKAASAIAAANTFETVARMWHENKLEQWQPNAAANILHRLEQDVFPLIGKRPITAIKARPAVSIVGKLHRIVIDCLNVL
jgi:hypothetical protein